MSSQHTPGPWWVSGIDSDEVHCRIFAKDIGCNVHIKLVDAPSVGDLIPDEQLKANARLIAAAPDLLYALQYLAAEFRSVVNSEFATHRYPDPAKDDPAYLKAMSAISKAIG